MRLYHYRPINSALLEIRNGTLHFATRGELNDPIEGYVRVYWQGDKAAWEGLLRNYVCSVSIAIDLYLLACDTNTLNHKTLITDLHQFDDVPLGNILATLGDAFLASEQVSQLATFFGKHKLKVEKEELQLILRFIHNEAIILCIEKCLINGTIPEKEANNLLASFRGTKLPRFPFDLMKDGLLDEKHRTIITRNAEQVFEDMISFNYIHQGMKDLILLHGNCSDIETAEPRQRRDWMSVVVDFPKVYTAQLKEMIYPESYMVCFSGKNDDSAMWGNYADCHKGVCLIYESDNDHIILNSDMRFDVKPVIYGGNPVERNFFETLGRLNFKQIRTWLTGVDGISNYYNVFKDEAAWRERYWSAYEAKNFRKLSVWKHENEYRLALANTFNSFGEPENRNLKYNPKALKGVIFGINTSENDKKMIVEALLTHVDKYDDFSFFQAEYDDKAQNLSIRKKAFWKLELS